MKQEGWWRPAHLWQEWRASPGSMYRATWAEQLMVLLIVCTIGTEWKRKRMSAINSRSHLVKEEKTFYCPWCMTIHWRYVRQRQGPPANQHSGIRTTVQVHGKQRGWLTRTMDLVPGGGAAMMPSADGLNTIPNNTTLSKGNAATG